MSAATAWRDGLNHSDREWVGTDEAQFATVIRRIDHFFKM